ncbi:Aluminum-activated malate transporter 8 [Capsicum baccatum]|uniref:Aluminum-activated malate transporter 8 n=1 Tax=Capsicum baccatum TaxID=33114 RepID=A0A2G2VV93_CAPBA|nr:Aluminum-activated malate transporter 8 [Capsicum baccatum]
MDKAYPLSTPMVVRLLEVSKNPFRPMEEGEEIFDPEVPYLSAIGVLMYLANATRPDIAFSVNLLARYSSSLTERHWNGIKHILRYLKGTIDMGLFYTNKASPDLVGHADAGALATFTRFFPHMKRRYDYGILIFVLTFSMVTVSGYRVDEILELAHQRLSTILIGAATCMIVSLVICPVWAGEDLHKLISSHLEKLATFLEGFGSEYFSFSENDQSGKTSKEDKKGFLEAYKTVLNSKATEESLANFAWWEPGHGCFRLRHPWKQYLKIGVLARECACHLQALSGYFNSKPQAPTEFHKTIQEACKKMSIESSKLLKELSTSIKTMTQPSSSSATHLHHSKAAVDDFKIILTTTQTLLYSNKLDLLQIFPAITVASILIDVINCLEKILEAVEELSVQAHFMKAKNNEVSVASPPPPQHHQLLHRGIVKPVIDVDDIEGGAAVAYSAPEVKPPAGK